MVHTLIAVHTDEGVLGVGSVFTSEALARASLDVLWPLVAGETHSSRSGLARSYTGPRFGWDGRRYHSYDRGDRHRPLGHIGSSHRAARGPAARGPVARPGYCLCLGVDGRAGANR